MIAKNMLFVQLLLMTWLLLSASCNVHTMDKDVLPPDSAYFSIKQFIRDQIHTQQGQPYTLTRVTRLNGSVDSTLVTITDMSWSPIISAFSETDIATRKSLGQYEFNLYDDNTTGSRNYVYTAKSPKLFTRLLQINSDPFNNRITSIYLETAKRDFFGSKTQKLLYIPMRIIQIQEADHPLIGKSKDLRIEFRYPNLQQSDQF